MRTGTVRAALAAVALAFLSGGCGFISGIVGDTTAPTVVIGSPASGSTVTALPFTVTATVSDDTGVTSVRWRVNGGAATACSLSGSDVTCSVTVLDVGANTVRIEALDAAGNIGNAQLSLTFDPTDKQPPSVLITSPGNGATVSSLPLTVLGTAVDDSAVTGVTYSVNGGTASACTVSGADFQCQVASLTSGSNTIEVQAVDAATNAGTASIDVDYTGASSLMITSPSGDLATTTATRTFSGTLDPTDLSGVVFTVDGGAGTACNVAGSTFSCDVTFSSGSQVVDVTASYTGGGTASDSRTVTYLSTPSSGGFDIQLVFFDESYTASQKQVFANAAARWSAILTNDLVDLNANYSANDACAQGEPGFEGTIDDLLIFVSSFTQDVGGVLGFAGPCRSRTSAPPDNGTNAVGIMYFDTMDVDQLESSGLLQSTILHEMGHVLGIGTNWEFSPYYDLLDYTTSDGQPCQFAAGFSVLPTYNGTGGVAAWHTLGGTGDVPVEDGGGAGTKCGHWDEETFGTELMTGYLNAGQTNPLSELTVRSFQDLGYTVDVGQADPYTLPTGPTTLSGTIKINEVLRRPMGTITPDGELAPLPR